MSKQPTYTVAPQDRVSPASKLCYSIGFAGKDGFQTITNNYLMMFLMMVVGLDGAFIGALMLGARIWDAINDPILGSIADHTNSRWGRFRPYVFSVVPMAIIFALLFFNPNLSMTGKMIYFTVVYVLYGMCYTVLEVPYFGLTGAMTFDPQERASITAWSRIVSRIPAVALPLLLGWFVTRFDAPGLPIGEKGAFYTAIAVGVIAIVASLFSFFGCKEKALVNAEPSAKKASGFQDFLNVLRGNWALAVVMIAQLFFTFNVILCDMLNGYYLTYSLGSPALIMGVGVSLVAVGACIGQFVYPYVASRVQSCKNIMLVGVPVYCVLLAVCYFAGKVSVPLYLVCLIVLNLFTGALQINVINLCFEVCDKLEYQNGVRADATVFAVVSFLMKLAAGLAATIAGWGLQLVGFQGMGPVMIEVTPAMASGVAVLRFALPGVLAVISFIAVLFYPIKKDEIISIRAELAKRHSKEAE
ncbi:MAG: MFS transporter [Oscillospiraceae bacterium]|nr:MFS transporter [Oscillospiraceae bacterium]